MPGPILIGDQPAAKPAGFEDLFDGPSVRWRQPANPGATRILTHERVRTERRGQACGAEHVRFACPAGYAGVFLYPIDPAPVLDDLKISLTYRGDTLGARLAVRVVFPRTLVGSGDASRPLTTIVRGDARYENVGEWAELNLTDLPLLAKRHVRLLRTDSSMPTIDERGAYVDSIVLIVPGSPTGESFWVERLTLSGALLNGEHSVLTKAGRLPASAEPESQTDKLSVAVRVSAGGFTRDGDAIFPRIWTSQGESSELVKQLGFNTLAVDTLPGSLSAEGQQDDLLLVGPPPSDSAASVHRVFAWMLPNSGDARGIDTALPEVHRIRNDRRLSTRPLLAAPRYGFAAWSRLTDGLVLDAESLRGSNSSRFSLAKQQAIPGSPTVARVRLSHSPQAYEQLRAFAPQGKASPWRQPTAIEAAVWSAVAGGAKGVWFDATKPLNGPGEAEASISAAVELLNLKLKLVEPWLTGGEPIGQVLNADGEPVAAILRRGRTKLLLGYAPVGAIGPQSPTPLVVPAVSETALAYAVTPAGLFPVQRQRTLGGVSIDGKHLGPGRFLLLTDDRRTVQAIETRIKKSAPRAVSLIQQVVLDELRTLETMLKEASDSPMAARLAGAPPAITRVISQSKAAESGGDLSGAYSASSEAQSLLHSARQTFRAALADKQRRDSSPLTHTPATWSDELRLRQLLRGLPRSGNLLAGGDFEDLADLKQQGWSHTRLENHSPPPTVELSSATPRHGERCLTLRATAKNDASIEPVAWVTSPQVPVTAGRLVEITGWVRFEADAATPGSLVVVDSLGGDELAIAVDQASGWRPFRLLRRPTRNEKVQVSFVLSGAGIAAVDAVMIRPIVLATPKSNAPPPPAVAGNAKPRDYKK
ncbi:MAG: hypothetical protein AAGF31_11560 [Planctomycetota bacterium]